MPGMPIPVRSIMIADVIHVSFRQDPSIVHQRGRQIERPHNDHTRSRIQYNREKIWARDQYQNDHLDQVGDQLGPTHSSGLRREKAADWSPESKRCSRGLELS
jgi:hypothetical protein